MALGSDDERIEEAYDPAVFYGRLAGLAIATLWGLTLAAASHRDESLMGNFMHAILLPIHEAGHVFFRPLGEFMTSLGGSLFQVALPLGIAVAFLWKQREPFGAAMCVWWTGASLVDVSPYIWDALHPQLILLGGHTGEEGGHDWVAVLGDLGLLRRAHGLGTFANWLGVVTMAGGIAWGAWYCWSVRRKGSG